MAVSKSSICLFDGSLLYIGNVNVEERDLAEAYSAGIYRQSASPHGAVALQAMVYGARPSEVLARASVMLPVLARAHNRRVRVRCAHCAQWLRATSTSVLWTEAGPCHPRCGVLR